MEKVIISKCSSYNQAEIDKIIEKIFEDLGGIESIVKPGNKVLIKPNIFAAFAPEKSATTHPMVVMAVCKVVKKAGGDVFIAESPCPSRESFETKARVSGIAQVAKDLDIPIFELKDPIRIDTPKECRIRKLEISKTAIEADVIINLPKLKTQTQQLYTCGVKNMFGCVVGTRKPEWHANLDLDRVAFASMLIDYYIILKPAITIVDAIWGMDGDGPANGHPKHIGVLAASKDALLLDLSLFKRINGNFNKLPLYQAAKQRRLISDDMLNNIEVSGDASDIFIKDFVFPDLGFALYSKGFIGRLMREYSIARPVGIPKNCIKCRSCEKICPKNAVKITDKKIIFYRQRCIRCYCCQEVCPANAITFKKPLLYKILNIVRLTGQ